MLSSGITIICYIVYPRITLVNIHICTYLYTLNIKDSQAVFFLRRLAESYMGITSKESGKVKSYQYIKLNNFVKVLRLWPEKATKKINLIVFNQPSQPIFAHQSTTAQYLFIPFKNLFLV